MPKYTKFLPPEEYEKLTLDQKTEYIIDMAELLRRRLEPSAPPDTNPLPDDEPNSQDQELPAPVDPDPKPPHQEPPAPVDSSPHQEPPAPPEADPPQQEPPAPPDTNPPPGDEPKNS